jgi:hypothetical protein
MCRRRCIRCHQRGKLINTRTRTLAEQAGSRKSFPPSCILYRDIQRDPARLAQLQERSIEGRGEAQHPLQQGQSPLLPVSEMLTDQGKVYVDPLVEEIVSTPQDVVDLLEKGNTQRKTGQTDWVRIPHSLQARC